MARHEHPPTDPGEPSGESRAQVPAMAAGSEPENVTGKASEAAPEGGRLRVDDWGLLTPDPRPGATVIEEEDGSGRENPLPLRSRGRDADRKPE